MGERSERILGHVRRQDMFSSFFAPCTWAECVAGEGGLFAFRAFPVVVFFRGLVVVGRCIRRVVVQT